MLRKKIDKFIFRHGPKNNSPQWAFLEGFRIPNIDDPKTDYLWRIRIVQTPWFGVYLHKLNTPDARHVLHNHPWAFTSFVLKGGYTEFVPGPGGSPESTAPHAVARKVNRINVKRFNNSYHWISELDRTPTWTLVFVGRRRRVWGYLEPDGTYTDFDKHEINEQYTTALDQMSQGDMV